MKHRYILVLFCLIGTIGVWAGCKSDLTELSPENGSIAFYNASQLLRKELEQKNPLNIQQPAFILLNTPVPVKPDLLTAAELKDFPFFAMSQSGQQFYPVHYSSSAIVPWISYMRVVPGKQEIAFLRTDTTLAVNVGLDIQKDVESTVFLTDSMGVYQTITANDFNVPSKNGISLRIIHAAPDAGDVKIKIQTSWLESVQSYRSVSGFQEILIPEDSQSGLLRFQVSPASDTTVVLGKYQLRANRSQTYTLILNGYLESYPETNYMSPDFRLSFIRNK